MSSSDLDAACPLHNVLICKVKLSYPPVTWACDTCLFVFILHLSLTADYINEE